MNFIGLNKWLTETDKKLSLIIIHLLEFKTNNIFSFKITDSYTSHLSDVTIKGVKTNKKYNGYIHLSILLDDIEVFNYMDYIRNDYIEVLLGKKIPQSKNKKLTLKIRDDNHEDIDIQEGIVYIV